MRNGCGDKKEHTLGLDAGSLVETLKGGKKVGVVASA
jgi:hypothetical protein